jgi:hypothetical protein
VLRHGVARPSTSKRSRSAPALPILQCYLQLAPGARATSRRSPLPAGRLRADRRALPRLPSTECSRCMSCSRRQGIADREATRRGWPPSPHAVSGTGCGTLPPLNTDIRRCAVKTVPQDWFADVFQSRTSSETPDSRLGTGAGVRNVHLAAPEWTSTRSPRLGRTTPALAGVAEAGRLLRSVPRWLHRRLVEAPKAAVADAGRPAYAGGGALTRGASAICGADAGAYRAAARRRGLGVRGEVRRDAAPAAR